jgi:hypothetical protein
MIYLQIKKLFGTILEVKNEKKYRIYEKKL